MVGGYPSVVHRLAWPLYRFPMVNNHKLLLLSFWFSYVILNSHLFCIPCLWKSLSPVFRGDNCRDQNWEPIYDTMGFLGQQPHPHGEGCLTSNFLRPLSVLIRNLPTSAVGSWWRPLGPGWSIAEFKNKSQKRLVSWSLPQKVGCSYQVHMNIYIYTIYLNIHTIIHVYIYT